MLGKGALTDGCVTLESAEESKLERCPGGPPKWGGAPVVGTDVMRTGPGGNGAPDPAPDLGASDDKLEGACDRCAPAAALRYEGATPAADCCGPPEPTPFAVGRPESEGADIALAIPDGTKGIAEPLRVFVMVGPLKVLPDRWVAAAYSFCGATPPTCFGSWLVVDVSAARHKLFNNSKR
jgi:hypothetical protein